MNFVHFMLDEAAMLNHLDVIDNAVGIGRGYGIRLTFIYQSLGQLEKCFPEGQSQTLLSNVTSVFFAVNDQTTADHVSMRLGEETIYVASGGHSHGTSWQSNSSTPTNDSHGGSTTTNHNWGLQVRKLLKPEEVVALPPRMALTFTPGVPPVATWLLRHYEEKDLLAKTKGQGKGQKTMLLRSLFVLTVASSLAAVLTHEIITRSEIPPPPTAKTSVETHYRVPNPGDDDEQIEQNVRGTGRH